MKQEIKKTDIFNKGEIKLLEAEIDIVRKALETFKIRIDLIFSSEENLNNK